MGRVCIYPKYYSTSLTRTISMNFNRTPILTKDTIIQFSVESLSNTINGLLRTMFDYYCIDFNETYIYIYIHLYITNVYYANGA